jgi:threonine synthase
MTDPADDHTAANTTTTDERGAATPRSLACPDCGTVVDDRWRCRCGAPLRFAAPPTPSTGPKASSALDTRAGLWAFAPFLAVGDDPCDRVTLGEGATPLVDAPEWDAAFKLEYVFPTGSFKDRGATTTLTRARELGVDRVVEDSSGNAGAAIATYAARAGIDAEVYVPADVKPAKLRAIRRAGATPVRIEGGRRAVTEACIDAVEGAPDVAAGTSDAADDPASGAWYASHAWNPAFFEGTATIAYEIAHQRDWSAPDAVVIPVGHGTLLLGAHWGFERLERAGWIDECPRLYAAQAAGIAPLVRALHGPEEATPASDHNAAADGIQIAEPVRLSALRTAVTETGGDAIAVTEAAGDAALDRLHTAGFYTEPTCAVAPAALEMLRDRGAIASDEDVVVPLTGSGLKT